MQAQSTTAADYNVTRIRDDDDAVIERALGILRTRIRHLPTVLGSPQEVKDYLRLKLGALEHEVFGCVFLDATHAVIEIEELFRGTVNQTSVYPREVVKLAFEHNATAVILYHNHPSGLTEPSRADEMLTKRLKDSLALIDVRVLDHFIVGGMQMSSFAEKGLL